MKIIISGWNSKVSKIHGSFDNDMDEIHLETIVHSDNLDPKILKFVSSTIVYKQDDIERVKKSIIMKHLSSLIDKVGFDRIEEIEIF